MRLTLALVIPVYNEALVIPALRARLDAVAKQIETEQALTVSFVLVNDGSKDGSRELLDVWGKEDSRAQILHLSRNFGHQAALSAGLDKVDADAIVVLDADLQDPPEVLGEMIKEWNAGFDVVYGVRKERKGESFLKKLSAAIFYRLFRSLVAIDVPVDAGDFRLMSRRAVLALRGLRESHRFVRGMVAWIGFKQKAVHYVREARHAGETKYPLRKMLSLTFDALASFSSLPLRVSFYFSGIAGLATFGIGAWALYARIVTNEVIPGWTSLLLLTAGIATLQFAMLGVIGEYVGRIYEQSKNRPLYVLEDEKDAPKP